ncbi:MAG: hypothetical protein ACQERB_06790 [Promethearchaeati archaeon]
MGAQEDCKLEGWFPIKEVNNLYIDLFNVEYEKLVNLFRGYDAMIYAVGPDDRITPEAPAYEFYHKRLVEACEKVVRAARKAGVKKCAICNSYFAYFERERPELKLKEKHPYIRSRVEQAEKCIAIGGNQMDVMIMELPYIFGTHPVRMPIWKDIIVNRLKKMKLYIFFFKGGSNMITVDHVAEAIVGAIEYGKGGKRYTIGDKNVKWTEWIKIMLDEMGIYKKIKILPVWIGTILGSYLRWKESREGKEAGLNYKYLFRDIQSQEFFFDPTSSQKELQYSGGELEETIRKTVQRCINSK